MSPYELFCMAQICNFTIQISMKVIMYDVLKWTEDMITMYCLQVKAMVLIELLVKQIYVYTVEPSQ